MMFFSVVNRISRGQNTMEAVVNFGSDEEKPELETRHLQFKNGEWFGRNSDKTRQERISIVKTWEAAKKAVAILEVKANDIAAAMEELKGKRDVAAKRAELRGALKTVLAALSAAKGDLERVTTTVGGLDKTHPEFVEFLA